MGQLQNDPICAPRLVIAAPMLAVAAGEPWTSALAVTRAADRRALIRLGQAEQARRNWTGAGRLAGKHALPHVLRDTTEAQRRLG